MYDFGENMKEKRWEKGATQEQRKAISIYISRSIAKGKRRERGKGRKKEKGRDERKTGMGGGKRVNFSFVSFVCFLFSFFELVKLVCAAHSTLFSLLFSSVLSFSFSFFALSLPPSFSFSLFVPLCTKKGGRATPRSLPPLVSRFLLLRSIICRRFTFVGVFYYSQQQQTSFFLLPPSLFFVCCSLFSAIPSFSAINTSIRPQGQAFLRHIYFPYPSHSHP